MCRKSIFLISFVVVLGLTGAASAELVARYSFDDGAASDSAYYCENAEGTFYGDAKVVDDPCRGLVLELDGTGDYVRVENNDVAEFSTESFSYSFWTKTTYAGTWFYFWKGIDYTGAETPDDLHGVNCYHDDSEWVRFSLYNYSGPDGELKSRTEVPEVNCVDGTWVHIACVRDVSKVEEELRFYVNGKLEPTPSTDYPNPNEDECGDISNPGHLYIGCNDRGYPLDVNSDPGAFFFGRIDDFRAYNHALSEQELERLANDMEDPNIASEPGPRDGARNVCPGVELSWTAGDNVVDHNVYFGTGLSDVNASATAYILHHPTNSFAPTLEFGETYYWRIDEVGATEVYKGYIWKFTTNDGNAFDPYPADGQRLVPLDPNLHWGPGCLAGSHQLYFGTDYNEVSAAEGSSEPNVYYEDLGDVNSYDPDANDYSTYYYWRVDEVNNNDGNSPWRGKVWNFKTEGAVFDPNLRVWYKLDETEGTDAADSSGREYDGDLEGDGVWDANGYYDGCFGLDDNGHIVIPMGVLGEIDKEITILAWLNLGTDGGHENVVCAAGADWEPDYVRVAVPDEDHDVYWRAGDESNDVMEWDGGNPKAWEGEWNHFAFVKDEDANKMQIYLNGLPVAEKTGASSGTLAGVRVRSFRIGAETDEDGDYIGKIDDFRVYDCALSSDRIAEIFRGGDLASAWGPEPYNGEDGVPYDVVLEWSPGDYATSHEVYFGTNWDDVNDANSDSHDKVEYAKRSVTSYDPCGLLELEQMYYWRVDEVNDINNDTWKGKVWKFIVADYVTIDDMEDYTENYNEYPISYWLGSWGWDCGFNNSTGSTLSLGLPEYGAPVRDKQSMVYSYDNTGAFYSEISNHFTMDPCDWTAFDRKILSLWFYGDTGNDADETEQMYVGLEDGDSNYAEVRYPMADMNDIKIKEWQEWNIALSDFNDDDPNLNLTNIEKLYIGFGDRNGSVYGGGGFMYFDDIRLYSAKCVLSQRPEEFAKIDFNNDCIVDFGDVQIMANQWLQVDVNLGEVTAPLDANLVGWWMLDEGSGSTAYDSSDYGNNGTIEVIDVNVSWVAGRNDVNYALEFDDGRVLVPDAQKLKPLHQVSVSAWIYYSEKQDSGRIVVKGADNKETYGLEVSENDELVFLVRDGNDYDVEEDDYEKYAAESGEDALGRDEWIHIAGTYDGNTVKCYINGEVADVCDTQNAIAYLCQDTNDLAIGNRPDAMDKPFEGTIDDVRVYNYALSAEEVAYIASDGGHNGIGIFRIQSVANLYTEEPLGSGVVNLRDFAKLSDAWLEEKMWPE